MLQAFGILVLSFLFTTAQAQTPAAKPAPKAVAQTQPPATAPKTVPAAPATAAPATPAAPTAASDPAKNAAQATPAPEPLKKIVITGSYIRRTVDESAPSPVTEIDASSKAAEAANISAGGIMRDNAIISSGGSSNISFHGQSSANNLVLLNGLRLPKPGGNDTADVDFIPANAIERVEILKDGASALYGSEALAGVVNFITKKEYDGSNISTRYTVPGIGHGQEAVVAATYGKSFAKGNVLASFQFRRTEPILYNQTEYGITDVQGQGSDVSSPGNFKQARPNGPNLAAADCPPGNLDGNGVCRYDYYENGLQYQAERNYYNGLLSTGWDLGNKLRLEAAIVGTHRRTVDLNTPIIMRFEDQSAGGGDNYSIPGQTAIDNGWQANLNGAINPTASYNVLYSADEELGRRKDINTLDAAMAQVKIGQELEAFDWDFAAGYGLSDAKTTTVDGNANKSILHQKMLNGDWNPFAPVGQKDNISDAFVETWNTNFADVANARAIVSGKAIDWGDRSIYAAFGIEEQLQSYRFRGDSLSLVDGPISGSASNQDGSRDAFSTFLELTQNPIHNLQIQLAGRFDKYSDFGSTVNPKLGAAYKVNETLTMRTSYGTGFKAPDLRALFQGDLTRPSRLRDEVICQTQGNSNVNCRNLFSTTSFGNPNLDAERGEHYNFGVQLRPKKNWQITMDHWRAEGTDQLNNIDLGRLTQAEFQFGRPAIEGLGVTIQRDPITNAIQSIRYPVKTNSGRFKTNGIDVEVRYKNQFNPFGLGNVNFGFKFDHSHTLGFGSQPFFFTRYERALDINWKNITSFSLSRGNHLASWRMRTFSAGDRDTSRSNTNPDYGSTPTYTEHDVHYEYYGAWNGVITLGIRNVMGQKLFNEWSRGSTGFSLPASDSPFGRTYYAGYSQDF